MNVTQILVILFFILSLCLVVFGIVYPIKLQYIIIPENKGVFNQVCTTSKVSCNTDSDCQMLCAEAASGEEFKCMAFPRFTDKQKQNYGEGGKFCVPKKAKMDCEIKYGAIPAFTGWSNPERMEFDCLCSYPLYASSQIFDSQGRPLSAPCQLNADVCEGGVFDWDLTKKIDEPRAELCTCPDDRDKVVDNAGVPHCVPKGFSNFYLDIYKKM